MLRAFPAGTHDKSTETCQIHQTKNDQSRKLVPIAPIHDTGDEYRIDGISFVDWGIVYPPINGGNTTLYVTAV